VSKPVGTRNKDFEAKRRALLSKLTDYALNADLRRPSLRQLAAAAGASEPTLRHYFSDRKGVVLAILEEIGRRGADIWSLISLPSETVERAVGEYFEISEAGMRHGGFVRAHAFGIIEGVADTDTGQAYLKFVLNPALEAIEQKMAVTPGAPTDATSKKAAALAVLSPILVLSLHQDLLGGQSIDPLDTESLLKNMRTLLVSGLSN